MRQGERKRKRGLREGGGREGENLKLAAMT